MAKYFKQDSKNGCIEDSALIEAQKFNNVRHSVLGYMLGDFDDSGIYSVNPEIVQELISMPKYIVETMENIEICQSLIKFDRQLSFMIIFEGNKATLTLIEKVSYESNHALNSGTWSNVNEYVLDEFETSGEINRQMLYIKWNISTYPGNVIDIFNCDPEILEKYFNIVNRFKYNLKANAMLLEKHDELEEIEAEYFLDIFAILKDYPELKEAVEKQIKETFEEKKDFLKIDKPNFAKTLNEVLEKAIEDNIEILPENEQETFVQQKHNVTVKSNIKKYEVLDLTKTQVEENTILHVNTGDVRFQPLNELAEEVAAVQKKVEEKIVESAVEVVEKIEESVAQEDSNKKKLTQVVEQIVKKEQAKVENLVSATTTKKLQEKKEEKIAAKAVGSDVKPAAQEAAKTANKAAEPKAAAKKPAAKKAAAKKAAKKPATKKDAKADKGASAAKKPSLDKIKKSVKEIEDLEKSIKKLTLDIETAVTYRTAAEMFNKLTKEYEKLKELHEKVKKEGKSNKDAAKLLKTAEESRTVADRYYKRAEYALNIKKARENKKGGIIASRVGTVAAPRPTTPRPAAPSRIGVRIQSAKNLAGQRRVAEAGKVMGVGGASISVTTTRPISTDSGMSMTP